MKIIYVLSTSLLLFLLFVSSCSPVMYGVVGHNVPMFKKKSEGYINIGAGYSSSFQDATDVLGFQIQGAYAITKSVGVTASFYSMGEDAHNKGTYGEIGAGKLWAPNKNKWVPGVFAGTGYGSIQNGEHFEKIKYVEPFVQPSFGYQGKNFEFVTSTKLTSVSYIKNKYSNQTPFALEPALTLRWGWPNFKFQFQAVLSSFKVPSDAYVSSGLSNEYFTSNNLYLSLSLQLRISQEKKNQ